MTVESVWLTGTIRVSPVYQDVSSPARAKNSGRGVAAPARKCYDVQQVCV